MGILPRLGPINGSRGEPALVAVNRRSAGLLVVGRTARPYVGRRRSGSRFQRRRCAALLTADGGNAAVGRLGARQNAGRPDDYDCRLDRGANGVCFRGGTGPFPLGSLFPGAGVFLDLGAGRVSVHAGPGRGFDVGNAAGAQDVKRREKRLNLWQFTNTFRTPFTTSWIPRAGSSSTVCLASRWN